ALSGNGSTALIGAPNNRFFGSAWVFTRSAGTWTQQGEELSPGFASLGSRFGASGALSGRGGTALVGGIRNQEKVSAVALTRSGAAWTQQGEALIPSNARVIRIYQGSLALSANGTTALIGEPRNNHGNGAAWVFTQSGGAWTQQGEGLNPSDESI